MRLVLIFNNFFKRNDSLNHKPKKILNYKSFLMLSSILLSSISIWLIAEKYINFSVIKNLDYLFPKIGSLNYDTNLKEIHLIGRENVSKSDLIEVLGLTNETSMLNLNLNILNEKIKKISWVKNSIVERRMPHTLIIKIEEFKPFALLQVNDNHNTHIIISSEGDKIIKDNGKFNYLPVINGIGSEKYAAKMLNILSSEPNLFHQVWAISYIGERRWNVSLRSGIKIKLPENNASEAWAKLSKIDREQSILSREVEIIDLRVKENLIITPSKSFNNETST